MQDSQARLFEKAAAGEGIAASREKSIPRFELLEISHEERQRRRASFGAGSLAQILVVALILWLLAVPPFTVEQPKSIRSWSARITLLTPPPASVPPKPRVEHVPAPPPLKRQAELPKVNPKPVVRPAIPPVTAKLRLNPVPKPPTLPAALAKAAAPRPAVPKRELQAHVGAFNSSLAVATTRLLRSRVQTGGFGNPHGLPAEVEGGNRGNVPHLGSFERPSGPGSGNGTGGEKGARALVASAGFGNGLAAGTGQGRGAAGDGQIHPAGFADARSLTQASPHLKPQPAAALFEPVVITAKPDPAYTEEARRLHIQGEVVLRVVFTASGQLQILDIAHGLGHGLDEAAVRAAQHIQFRPARRNGQPVNITATLDILFQLAD